MKKRLVYRVFISLFLIILLGSQLIHSSVAFAESNPVKEKEANSIYLEVGSRHALVYGELKNMTSTPVFKNDTTLVPLRFISEQLGAKVSWEEDTMQITLEKGADTIVLHIGSNQMLVNGNPKTLLLPPQSIDDRTFVPLRSISESFGKTVFYENGLIGISDEGAALQIGQEDTLKSKLLAQLAPQEINISYSEEPYTLDSSLAYSFSEWSMINLFHEGLYRLNESGIATPALANSLPSVSQDGLTYTISLREGLEWSDGAPLTAKDFVYAVNRTAAPSTQASYAFIVNKISDISAPDDTTLVIKLVQPYPQFAQLLAIPCFFPQRQDHVESLGDQYGSESANVIGAGPFLLDYWEHDGQLAFVKNDRYWDAENVHLDQVNIFNIEYAEDSIALYTKGKIDFTRISGDPIQYFKNDPDFYTKNDLINAYILFQEKKVPAFSNKKIRQALSMAIDKEEMVSTLHISGRAAYGLVPNGTFDGNGGDFRKSAGSAMEEYNPDKAKQLLQEGLKELGLQQLPTFTLLSDDTNAAKRADEYIVSEWKSVLGIDVHSNPIPHAERIDQQTDHNFEAAISLWGADYNDPMSFLELFTTQSEFNDAEYSSLKFNYLIGDAYAEKDAAKRTQLLVKAEKQLMEDMPIAPLYFRERAFLINPSVKGMFLPAFGFEWELKWASKSN